MSDSVQSLVVLGDGPSAPTILTADKLGLRDGSSRYLKFWEQLSYYLVAVPTANYIWRCYQGVWVVEYVHVLARVTGGTSATLDVLVCQQVEAVASGVTQLGAVVDIEETAPFQAAPALIASPTEIYPGDSVAVNLGGTATGIVGLLSVILKRIQ